jgi:hypothetical protein
MNVFNRIKLFGSLRNQALMLFGWAVALMFLCRVEVFAQSPEQKTTEPKPRENVSVQELTEIINAALAQADKYNLTFRDLTTQEKRISEILDYSGRVVRSRVAVCDLFVYKSRLDEKWSYEYRVITTVDGKPVETPPGRAEKIFSKLSKADSARKELEIINDEGFRFDLTPIFYGMSLQQWREIRPYALNSVGFSVLGREKVDGAETVVLVYRQLAENVQLEWKLPDRFKDLPQRTRGRLWLDIKTLQIRRAERELTVQYKGQSEPAVVWRQFLEYAPSEYGIFVPRKFSYEFYYLIMRRPDGGLLPILSSRLSSEFGVFQRFDVSGEEQGKKTVIKEEKTPESKPPGIKP